MPKLSDFTFKETKKSFPTFLDLERDISETGLHSETIPIDVPSIKDITITGDGEEGDKKADVFVQNKTNLSVDIPTLLQKPLPVTLAPKGYLQERRRTENASVC